jgi:cell division protease FtsH
MFLPEGDRYSHSREYLESKLSSLFGGRLAEVIIFGDRNVTTGASNDIQKATEIARNMVTKWGLSQKVGPLTLGNDDEEVFLGHSITRHKEVSEATSSIVDDEIRELIERNYQRANKILNDNIDKLHAMAQTLIKYETIGQEQIEDIMAGRIPREPAGWSNIEKKSKQQQIPDTKLASDNEASQRGSGVEGVVDTGSGNGGNLS